LNYGHVKAVRVLIHIYVYNLNFIGLAMPPLQLTVMPILAPIIGEEMLLIIGLLGGCTHVTDFH
jgi:hypothetical protein